MNLIPPRALARRVLAQSAAAMRRARAFTLLELLVVVAIIATLIAILLPALGRAREQGKIAVCLANERSIGVAQTAYLNEFDDIPWCLPLPFKAGGNSYSFNVISGFIWGGGMPDKTPDDWSASGADWQGFYQPDVYVIPPRYRPMNRFIAPSVSWDRDAKDRTKRPADIPAVFRCPSDSSLSLGWVGRNNKTDDIGTPYMTWAFLGTSFTVNFYWPYYYQKAPPGNGPPYNGDYARILGVYPDVAKCVGTLMLRNKSGRWAAEFITFCENRMNFALEAARPRGAPGGKSKPKLITGWHRQLDYHSALFLDGHSAYRNFDTRYIDGPGWTTWANRPWQGDWAAYNSN